MYLGRRNMSSAETIRGYTWSLRIWDVLLRTSVNTMFLNEELWILHEDTLDAHAFAHTHTCAHTYTHTLTTGTGGGARPIPMSLLGNWGGCSRDGAALQLDTIHAHTHIQTDTCADRQRQKSGNRCYTQNGRNNGSLVMHWTHRTNTHPKIVNHIHMTYAY